jgi:hypothetical protein
MTFFDDTALQYPARAEFLFFALERDKKNHHNNNDRGLLPEITSSERNFVVSFVAVYALNRNKFVQITVLSSN